MADRAVAVEVAEAVTSRIRGANFTQDFQLERSWATWDLKLENLDALALDGSEAVRVDVVAHTTSQAAELSSRGSIQYTIPVDIAVRRKFDTQAVSDGRVPVADVDALMLLVQDLHLLFTPQRLADFQAAVWESTDLVAAPVREHLREFRQFTAIVRITFRADRKV